jgi:putative intracellular protease/amidase
MEFQLPPDLVERLIIHERAFNAALVSLKATIDEMYSDAGDVPLNPASVIRAAVSAPEGASGLSALVLPGGQLGEVAYRRGAEARFK